MISGLIVYNAIDVKKNQWFIDKCLQKLNDEEVSLSFLDEAFLEEYVKTHKISFVIYRGRNYKIVEYLENKGIKVFNNSLTNKVANNKFLTYEFFKKHNLPFITTSYEPINSFPYIMKSTSGHGGQEVFLINSDKEREEILKQHPKLDFIYQEYLKNNGDVRLYVLNNSVVTAVKRSSQKDFRNNFSLGGEVIEYSPNEDMKKIAIAISKLLKANFIGVDFLLTDDGYKLIEIEDPVGSRMVYQTTDIDIINIFKSINQF